MIKRSNTRALALGMGLLWGLASGQIHAGPSEINGLEQELATCKSDIASTQEAMRASLAQYGSAAGELGVRLRGLKLNRARIEKDLQEALAAHQERERRDGYMPTATVAKPPVNRSLTTPAPETMMPAPAL